MKEEHEKLRAKYLTEYIYEKHNQDKCLGFIDGFEKAIQALSQSEGESIIKEIERRLLIIKSEPNGIVRETMLDDLLINLTPPKTK